MFDLPRYHKLLALAESPNRHEAEAGQLSALGIEGVEVRQLSQPHPRGDIRQVEFTAHQLDLHAVGTAPDHALQPVLFSQRRLAGVVDDQAATLDRRHVLVRMETE